MDPARISYKIYQGSTFLETLRWESETKQYVPISAITNAAPCVITTTAAHTIPLNWRVRVTGVNGMKDINNISTDSYYLVTSKTTNTITLNQINSASFSAYTSGGIIEYNTPVPLNYYTARMQIRETIESDTVLAELTTQNGGIVIDPINYTISLKINAAVTATFNFDSAVYSCELIDSASIVYPFLTGSITLVKDAIR
jgi:hypothetical protein